ncbi:hypothetical protein [Pseudomonas frederiksbergensis]|uniref:hypothetical protein n=1 Tax=Pseudomonas frederiksbergensis TaxID=104087 RepID=UPI003D215ADE
MSMHSDPEQPVAASTSDAGILLDQPRVLGVDPLDPSGTLPADARLNGITVIIPQWPNFPTGVQVHTVDIYIVGIINAVAQRSYRAADVAPEFFIPIPAALLPVTPSFEIFYNVRTPNPTTSPIRRLTFRVAPPPQELAAPIFPDATIYGYINCNKVVREPPDSDALFVWEGIRISIPFDDRFLANDVIQLVWQCWTNLNGSGPALTPPGTFLQQITAADISGRNNIRIVILPFNTWIEPMTTNNSADATYTLVRNGVPQLTSFKGIVKVDRKIPGESGFCKSAP